MTFRTVLALRPGCLCQDLKQLHIRNNSWSHQQHCRSRGYAPSPTALRVAASEPLAEGHQALQDGAAEVSGREPLEQGQAEYAALKRRLMARSQRAGGLLAAYLFLTASGEAALLTLLGSASGCVYLALLMRDVDAFSVETPVPLVVARDISGQPLRTLALGVAAYRHALQPRLLVFVGCAALLSLWNRKSGHPLSTAQQLYFLLGALSYKASLVLQLWDDSKPKFDPEALTRPARPQLTQLPEVKTLEGLQSRAEDRQSGA